MTPGAEPAFTVAPDSVQLWKSGRGRTPLLPPGTPAIHSALELAHHEPLCIVVKLSAEWPELVTFSV